MNEWESSRNVWMRGYLKWHRLNFIKYKWLKLSQWDMSYMSCFVIISNGGKCARGENHLPSACCVASHHIANILEHEPLLTVLVYNQTYFLTILDDHSRFLWIVLLKIKFEVSAQVQNFVIVIRNQHKVTPKIVITHNNSKLL